MRDAYRFKVYLSGESRPSPARYRRVCLLKRVYLSGESRPSPAAALRQRMAQPVYLSGESQPSPAAFMLIQPARLVYLSGESRPSPAIAMRHERSGAVYLSGECRPSPAPKSPTGYSSITQNMWRQKHFGLYEPPCKSPVGLSPLEMNQQNAFGLPKCRDFAHCCAIGGWIHGVGSWSPGAARLAFCCGSSLAPGRAGWWLVPLALFGNRWLSSLSRAY